METPVRARASGIPLIPCTKCNVGVMLQSSLVSSRTGNGCDGCGEEGTPEKRMAASCSMGAACDRDLCGPCFLELLPAGSRIARAGAATAARPTGVRFDAAEDADQQHDTEEPTNRGDGGDRGGGDRGGGGRGGGAAAACEQMAAAAVVAGLAKKSILTATHPPRARSRRQRSKDVRVEGSKWESPKVDPPTTALL